MNKSELARDKRLHKKYGISLAQRNAIAVAQNHKCAICGRDESEFTHGLVVDHYHTKITVSRDTDGWNAVTHVPKNTAIETTYMSHAKTKQAAIDDLKKRVLPHTVRGLLCPGKHCPRAGSGCCNRNLARIDCPTWLLAAWQYLQNPPARKILASGKSE